MRLYESKFRSAEGRHFFEQWYQSVLQQASTNYSCKYVKTRFGDTHVALGGGENKDNPPVIFLHGWSGNGMLWDLTDDLNGVTERYRTYLVDVIGQPGHSSQRTPPIHSQGYGEWLVDLLDELNLPKARFVGMSFGAILIAKLAAIAPERISQAALVAPAGFAGIRKEPRHLLYFLAPRLNTTEANLERFVRKMVLGPNSNPSDALRKQIIDLFRISFQHHIPGAQWPRVLPDEAWAKLSMPSLVLTGEKDALFDSSKVVSRAKAVLPQLKGVERYAGLGHAMENYVMLTERIRRFFERQE